MGVFTSTKQFRLGLNLTNPWWLSGASIDLDFRNGRYYDSSLSALKRPLAAVSDYLSCTRASIGYAKTAAGTLMQFTNNVLRLTDLGLLVEDARTNYAAGQDITNGAVYTVAGGSGSGSITAPDGSNTAQQYTEDSTTGFHRYYTSFSINPGASQSTFSIFLKNGATNGRRYVWLIAVDSVNNRYTIVCDLVSGTITANGTGNGTPVNPTFGLEAYGNGWFRAFIKLDDSIGAGEILLVSGGTSGSPSLNGDGANYAGDGVSNFYVWGHQVENGAFPSSYIPTTTTSAARAADTVAPIGDLNTILTTEPFSVYADVKTITTPLAYWRIVGDHDGAQHAYLHTGVSGDVGGYANGVTLLATFGGADTFSSGVKVAAAQSSSGRSIVGDGGTVATDANHNILGVATIRLGRGNDPNNDGIYGYFRRLTVWNSRIADATLQALTAP